MTVIAYRNGQMAADSSGWVGDTNAHTVWKVHRVGGGLVGGAGLVSPFENFVRWLKEGADEEEFPTGAYEAIVVDPTGRVTVWYGSGMPPIKSKDPYCAIGSGQDFALGALHAGADARGAVKAAIRHTATVKGPIRVYKLRRDQ